MLVFERVCLVGVLVCRACIAAELGACGYTSVYGWTDPISSFLYHSIFRVTAYSPHLKLLVLPISLLGSEMGMCGRWFRDVKFNADVAQYQRIVCSENPSTLYIYLFQEIMCSHSRLSRRPLFGTKSLSRIICSWGP